MFANDFVELAETGSALEILMDVVHNYSKHWRFEANVKKCSTVVSSKQEGFHHPRPTSKESGFGVMKAFSVFNCYCYLGIEFSSDGSWD